jgi:hypothetical protein
MKYDNNHFIIASRAYSLQLLQFLSVRAKLGHVHTNISPKKYSCKCINGSAHQLLALALHVAFLSFRLLTSTYLGVSLQTPDLSLSWCLPQRTSLLSSISMRSLALLL